MALATMVGALGLTLKPYGTTEGERAAQSRFLLRLRENIDTLLVQGSGELEGWTPAVQSLVNAYFFEMVEQLGISLPLPSSSNDVN